MAYGRNSPDRRGGRDNRDERNGRGKERDGGYKSGWATGADHSAPNPDSLMERRRIMREDMQGTSVRGVWAKSPPPPKWATRDLDAARRGENSSYYTPDRYPDDEMGRKEAKHRAAVSESKDKASDGRSRRDSEKAESKHRKSRKSASESESDSTSSSDSESDDGRDHKSKQGRGRDEDKGEAEKARKSTAESTDLGGKDGEAKARKDTRDAESGSGSDARQHKRRKSQERQRDRSKRSRRSSSGSGSATDGSSSDSDSGDAKSGEDEAEWVEKVVEPVVRRKNEDDLIVGPSAPNSGPQIALDKKANKAMRPGEADAMAAFIEEGKRIPRRGEIGLTPDEITEYEKSGYIMSGSRHRRMEAVRLRKEQQMYTADERRAMAMFNYEERMKKEKELMSQFREQVQDKLRRSDLKKQ